MPQELENLVKELGEPKFRAKQIFAWLQMGVRSFDEMTNIPITLRQKLNEIGYLANAEVEAKFESKLDETVKFLFKMNDGLYVESVLMKYKHGYSICISTQIGCRMGCTFCASTVNGLDRSLTASEMLAQIMSAQNVCSVKISNIVLMGSGEPLDNFDNVARFLSQITDEKLFNFSVRNITVSTCGLAPKIEKLADLGYNVTLSISLHAPNDTIRKQIMPIAKSYPISTIMESAKYYNLITSRRITIEYTLIEGVNNTPNHAKQLAALLTDFPCHVNLIKLNEVDGRNLKSPSIGSCKQFLNILTANQISATLRRSLGDDIEGACGQLRNKELSKKGE